MIFLVILKRISWWSGFIHLHLHSHLHLCLHLHLRLWLELLFAHMWASALIFANFAWLATFANSASSARFANSLSCALHWFSFWCFQHFVEPIVEWSSVCCLFDFEVDQFASESSFLCFRRMLFECRISNRLTSYRAQLYDQNKLSFDSIASQVTALQVKNRKSKFFALTQAKIDDETKVHQRRRKNHQFRQ